MCIYINVNMYIRCTYIHVCIDAHIYVHIWTPNVYIYTQVHMHKLKLQNLEGSEDQITSELSVRIR